MVRMSAELPAIQALSERHILMFLHDQFHIQCQLCHNLLNSSDFPRYIPHMKSRTLNLANKTC